MVFNDALDHNLDRLRHKERPIPSGEVTAEQARRFGMVLFIVADTLACAVQFTAGIAAFVAFLLIMIYNGYAKERGLLGALVMGSIRFANFGLGIFAAGLTRRQFIAFPTGNAWAAAGILGGYVVLLTLLSQLEEKPSRPRLLICSTLMLLAPVGAWAMGPTTMAAITAGALVLLVGGVAAAGAVVPSKESTMRAVLWSIVGIILLDATFVFARGSEMEPRGAAIAALILPVLATRPLFKNL
jgi:4-hydroxybenzoate polyprenyltransferase